MILLLSLITVVASFLAAGAQVRRVSFVSVVIVALLYCNSVALAQLAPRAPNPYPRPSQRS